MRAITYTQFGSADVLQLVDDAPDPVVGPDTVLVRVEAVGVNPVDTKIREGYLQTAIQAFFPVTPGWDVAGVVEAVGPAVTEFVPGDPVLGYVRKDVVHDGTTAELAAAPVRTLARRPDGLDAVQAAALPLAGLTADQALDAASVGSGDTVLVHAASGGVGHLAAQLARHRGARVIGTASEANHDFLRDLGVEPVRYGDGLVEAVRALAPQGVDASVDLAGGDALDAAFTLTAQPGRVVSIVGGTALQRGGRYVFVRPAADQLGRLAGLVADGTLRVEVAEVFPLERTADAHRRSESGHVRGKVVIAV